MSGIGSVSSFTRGRFLQILLKWTVWKYCLAIFPMSWVPKMGLRNISLPVHRIMSPISLKSGYPHENSTCFCISWINFRSVWAFCTLWCSNGAPNLWKIGNPWSYGNHWLFGTFFCRLCLVSCSTALLWIISAFGSMADCMKHFVWGEMLFCVENFRFFNDVTSFSPIEIRSGRDMSGCKMSVVCQSRPPTVCNSTNNIFRTGMTDSMLFYGFIYVLTKSLELLDTVFLILKKRPVIFLHGYGIFWKHIKNFSQRWFSCFLTIFGIQFPPFVHVVDNRRFGYSRRTGRPTFCYSQHGSAYNHVCLFWSHGEKCYKSKKNTILVV